MRTWEIKGVGWALVLSIAGLVGCSSSADRERRLRALESQVRALELRASVLDSLEGFDYASKVVEMVGSPRGERWWIEHWRDGKKVAGERPPPHQPTRQGMRPVLTPWPPHSVHYACMAVEDPERPGWLRVKVESTTGGMGWGREFDIELPEKTTLRGELVENWNVCPVMDHRCSP